MHLREIIDQINKNEFRLDTQELNPFYRSYLDVFNGCSEAPSEFILTILLAALGSAISLSRWITWGTKRLYPNFWVLILGESTRSRKSTSLDIGLKIIKMFNEQKPDRNYLLPSRASISALLQVLQQEKHGVIEHSEIATFLEMLKKGFNCDMKSILTSFFDVPDVYKINFITQEDTMINYPIFSLATASTPTWLKESLKKGDATSGFLARFLFAYCNRKDRSIPIPLPPDPERIQKLMSNFQKIYDFSNEEITLDQGFKEIYTQFYRECDELIFELPFDNGLVSLLSRLQTDYFLKLTILECVLTNQKQAGRVEASRVKYLVSYYMSQAIYTIKHITPDSQMELERKILDLIRARKEASRTDLYRLFQNNISSGKLNAALQSLVKAEQVVGVKLPAGNKHIFRLPS